MSRRSLQRLDSIIGEINAGLLAIAIGLATLDVAVFVALETSAVTDACVDCVSTADSEPPVPVTGAPMTLRME